jgi:plasmanylethanolamine desaturase
MLLATAAADIVSVFLCLMAADFITGLIHWTEDTWTAPGTSALLDKWIVFDNIEHHRRPGSIRNGAYWTTNRVCIAGAAIFIGVLALLHVHAWQPYLIAALASQGNQIHMWAHSSDRPRWVRRLQAVGVLQSRAHHGRHHINPYAVRFCAYTDYLNPILDATRFWRALEWLPQQLGATVQRATPARGGY